MKERSRRPLHLSYRAVGSSTGQKEFLGALNTPTNTAWNDFGAGDIPMTSSRYNSVVAAGRQMVHVPFAMGAIGVFHSVPSANLGGQPLDLNGCLLARIFSRDITTWNHPDILALNPGLTYTGDIKVVHRVHGSSSTAGFTQYLSGKCPASWTLGSGSTITWPAGTFEGQGSGGMASFIQSNVGAIGYIDAGHGHNAGLGEIALQNREGVYLTTRTADIGAAGTIALAAGSSVIPSDPSSDFSSVNLYDLAGPTTWPITMISYFYINKDISTMDPVEAGILMYFVRFILGSEGQALAVNNLFVPLPQTLLDYNAQTLGSITTPSAMPTFSTETAGTTRPQQGAANFVISAKRRSFDEVTGTKNTNDITALRTGTPGHTHPGMSQEGPVSAAIDSMFTTNAAGDICSAGICLSPAQVQGMVAAALVMAILGFLIGFIACIGMIVLCCNRRTTKPRSVEIKARDIEVPSSTVGGGRTSDDGKV